MDSFYRNNFSAIETYTQITSSYLNHVLSSLYIHNKRYSGWTFSGLLKDGGQGRRGQKSSLLSKISHIYPTMMKLGSYTLPKEDPKNI